MAFSRAIESKLGHLVFLKFLCITLVTRHGEIKLVLYRTRVRIRVRVRVGATGLPYFSTGFHIARR